MEKEFSVHHLRNHCEMIQEIEFNSLGAKILAKYEQHFKESGDAERVVNLVLEAAKSKDTKIGFFICIPRGRDTIYVENLTDKLTPIEDDPCFDCSEEAYKGSVNLQQCSVFFRDSVYPSYSYFVLRKLVEIFRWDYGCACSAEEGFGWQHSCEINRIFLTDVYIRWDQDYSKFAKRAKKIMNLFLGINTLIAVISVCFLIRTLIFFPGWDKLLGFTSILLIFIGLLLTSPLIQSETVSTYLHWNNTLSQLLYLEVDKYDKLRVVAES